MDVGFSAPVVIILIALLRYINVVYYANAFPKIEQNVYSYYKSAPYYNKLIFLM